MKLKNANIYLIAREDFFKSDNGLLHDQYQIIKAGPLWMELIMTEKGVKSYKFKIEKLCS